MRKLSAVVGLVVISVVSVVYAANTQVSSDSWRAIGKTGAFYGRSDGVFQKATGKSPYVIENGKSAQPIGTGFYLDFTTFEDGEGLFCRDESNLGACTGNAALAPCICSVGDGNKFVWLPLVQEDTAPDMDAGSMDIGADQTDNDGPMLLWGVAGASGRPFVIGTDPAFYMCTTAAVEDVTGIDQNIMAGFLVMGSGDAMNADFEALDEYAGIGILGTAAAAVTAEDITIKTETDADVNGTGDGVVSTDTTDDATESVQYKYCVYVSATGAVTYTVNGAAPTVTAAYSFRDDVSVVPFITYLHTNDVAGEIDLYKVEVAYQ